MIVCYHVARRIQTSPMFTLCGCHRACFDYNFIIYFKWLFLSYSSWFSYNTISRTSKRSWKIQCDRVSAIHLSSKPLHTHLCVIPSLIFVSICRLKMQKPNLCLIYSVMEWMMPHFPKSWILVLLYFYMPQPQKFEIGEDFQPFQCSFLKAQFNGKYSNRVFYIEFSFACMPNDTLTHDLCWFDSLTFSTKVRKWERILCGIVLRIPNYPNI